MTGTRQGPRPDAQVTIWGTNRGPRLREGKLLSAWQFWITLSGVCCDLAFCERTLFDSGRSQTVEPIQDRALMAERLDSLNGRSVPEGRRDLIRHGEAEVDEPSLRSCCLV